MPGEIISIDTQNYPELAAKQEGDSISLKLKGTVSGISEDGVLEITTESIEETDINTAEHKVKQMMGRNPKAKKMPMKDMDEE